jgi:hypothetical protein
MKSLIIIVPIVLLCAFANAQEQKKWKGKFEQLDQLLPTPNEYRTGSGEPGTKYWQQRADYTIDAEIDEPTNTLKGKETITYYNNSPETLKYLWLQLDQNINKKGNEDFGNYYGPVRDSLPTLHMQYITRTIEFEGGYSIQSVTDKTNKSLPITINNTMMCIDLPVAIKTGESYTFNIAWSYPITDRSLFLLSREGIPDRTLVSTHVSVR